MNHRRRRRLGLGLGLELGLGLGLGLGLLILPVLDLQVVADLIKNSRMRMAKSPLIAEDW